jgi:hypothetical protein
MPWCPAATKRPISGGTDGPMQAHLGIALHVNESNGNLYNWVAGDNGMSCHFEVYKDGTAEQYIDTANDSWCQMAGNGTYISIETEGYATEPFTAAQVDKIAQIAAWASKVHGIPLQVADRPADKGIGWHGMGGAAWGGHTGCPGDKRKAQRAQIITKAKALLAPPPPPEENDMALSDDDIKKIAAAVWAYQIENPDNNVKSSAARRLLGTQLDARIAAHDDSPATPATPNKKG